MELVRLLTVALLDSSLLRGTCCAGPFGWGSAGGCAIAIRDDDGADGAVLDSWMRAASGLALNEIGLGTKTEEVAKQRRLRGSGVNC
jgi:hypothetical protein